MPYTAYTKEQVAFYQNLLEMTGSESKEGMDAVFNVMEEVNQPGGVGPAAPAASN